MSLQPCINVSFSDFLLLYIPEFVSRGMGAGSPSVHFSSVLQTFCQRCGSSVSVAQGVPNSQSQRSVPSGVHHLPTEPKLYENESHRHNRVISHTNPVE